VATPRIPVHHAQEMPIGGKLPSYFVLKSLAQSFPLEWRDVLRYQRLRKLHADLHAENCAPLRDPSEADPARLLARGGRRRGHAVVLARRQLVQMRVLVAGWSVTPAHVTSPPHTSRPTSPARVAAQTANAPPRWHVVGHSFVGEVALDPGCAATGFDVRVEDFKGQFGEAPCMLAVSFTGG
jgi:hypothetical protein